MQWDWSRVNPRGGMTATMAKVLAVVMLLTAVTSVMNATRSSGALMWLALGVALLTLALAAWMTAVAAGVVRRS